MTSVDTTAFRISKFQYYSRYSYTILWTRNNIEMPLVEVTFENDGTFVAIESQVGFSDMDIEHAEKLIKALGLALRYARKEQE